jgi:hypothetical protein
MDYGEVLSRAWKIIWKHKILWIFGIFAGCSRGGGGGGGGNSGFRTTTPGGNGQQFQQFGEQFSNWIGSHLWVIVLAVVIFLVIIVVALLLGTIGRIGLIKGTQKADAGAEHLGFAELWDESLPYFWRIFLLSLLVGLVFLIVLLPAILLIVGFSVLTMGIGVLCLIPLLCVMIPASLAVQLIVQQAESAIVLENLGVMDGLRRGWDVFRKNLGPMLIMWLVLGFIGLIAGLVIAIPILAIVIPAAVAFGLANAQATSISWTSLIVAGACCVAYFPVLLALDGILMAYLQSAWTLTFLRLTKPKEPTNVESPIVPAPNA